MSVLLEAKDLVVELPRPRGLFGRAEVVHALNGVDLSLERGEVLGVVGESGSGKTTLGRALLGLVPLTGGTVVFDGVPIRQEDERALRPLRRRFQLIFQDPYSSLNPRMTAQSMLQEAIDFHQVVPPEQSAARVEQLLQSVGLDPTLRSRYPHELSGGQRQRLGIARALSVGPELLVADEPVSALDVSVRAQILELLIKLRRELGLTMLFIAHDLEVVRAIADRVLVLYLGRVVETLPAAALHTEARHPYTRALLAAAPTLARPLPTEPPLQGEPPSPLVLPPGCAFAGRCPLVQPSCTRSVPPLISIGAHHAVACPIVAPPGLLA